MNVCQPDLLSREVCFLPGAQIQDVMEMLPRIVCASDYYPLLLIHVGTNDTKGKLETIKQYLRALGGWSSRVWEPTSFSPQP